jgi:hypothetical protein
MKSEQTKHYRSGGKHGRRLDGWRTRVAAVAAAERHGFSKASQNRITLVAGLGGKGDAHSGVSIQHDRTRDPCKANLRQVHPIEWELLDNLATRGFVVAPGELRENITTRDIGLLRLGEGMLLGLGATAIVRLTGLRAPCIKIARFQKGLQKAVTAERAGYTFTTGAVMAITGAGATSA